MSAPANSTLPFRGSMIPEIVFRIVDLPAPFAPSTVPMRPFSTARLTPRIARIGPYALSTLRSFRMLIARPRLARRGAATTTSSAAPRYASTTPGWRCTSAGVPRASIWPWFIARTRSETFETSVMSCSTISTVMPSSARMSSIQNAMSSLSSTFSPDDGSSSRMQLRLGAERARQLDHLAHAVGKPGDERLAMVLQVEQVDDALDRLARRDLGGARLRA